ncbi:hypothetical protein P8452_34343 [Trifolium repens]|nr:hypothetical protein P8452_34343 [Trifolium repens]
MTAARKKTRFTRPNPSSLNVAAPPLAPPAPPLAAPAPPLAAPAPPLAIADTFHVAAPPLAAPAPPLAAPAPPLAAPAPPLAAPAHCGSGFPLLIEDSRRSSWLPITFEIPLWGNFATQSDRDIIVGN